MRFLDELPKDDLFGEFGVNQWGYPEPNHFMLPDECVKRFSDNSCEKVIVSYLVSNADIDEIGKVTPILPKGHFQIEISTEKLNGVYRIANITLDNVCLKGDSETREIVVPGERNHFAFGHYLRIVIGHEGAGEDELRVKSSQIIATLRVLLGVGVASQELQSYVLDIPSEKVTFVSESKHNWSNDHQTDIRPIQQICTIEENRQAIEFNQGVIELLNLAFAIQIPSLRYLTLWMCIELQLGDGRRRKEFFEKELGSVPISKLVKGLHDTRNEIVHEFNDVSASKSLLDLLEILRLTGLRDNRLRSLLVSDMETRLGDPAA
ncbi:MAG: hypothetical protein AAFQ79_14600 [Pseudomonadota bacterium]